MATIKVNIKAKQVFEFNQDVEMEIEDYEKVKHLDCDDIGAWHKSDQEAYSIIENYINPNDVFSAEQEYTDVSVLSLIHI